MDKCRKRHSTLVLFSYVREAVRVYETADLAYWMQFVYYSSCSHTDLQLFHHQIKNC